MLPIYNIDESAKTKSCSEYEPYAGFPISSEMAGAVDNLHIEQPKTINLTARLKQKAQELNVKPLLKAGLTAAAVIAIGFALLLNAPAAKAVTIEQIYRAIENARNVYIATFEPGKTEHEQERWVSRSLNIYLSKTEKESVLSNISNRVRTVKNLDTGLIKTASLSAEMITETEKMMAGFLGLVPFADVSVIPDDAEWNRVTSNELIAASDTAIYELIWIERTLAGNKVFNKWQVFVDPKTYLPRKTESYTKRVGDSDYTLRSAMEVEYLSDSEMEDVVKKASF